MNELPQRKRNRLPGYDYRQNGAYFITICAKDRHEIFEEIIANPDTGAGVGDAGVGADAHIGPQIKLTPYGKTVERHLQHIPGLEKYVIMPNHIHMIIAIYDTMENGPMQASSPTQGISQRVRSFKTMVTKELGFSAFQRSFYDHIIRDDAEYEQIWQYIENNPAKWEEDRFYNAPEKSVDTHRHSLL